MVAKRSKSKIDISIPNALDALSMLDIKSTHCVPVCLV
jgi:hypothetical protein